MVASAASTKLDSCDECNLPIFFSSRLQALRRGKAIKSETGSEMNMRAIKAC